MIKIATLIITICISCIAEVYLSNEELDSVQKDLFKQKYFSAQKKISGYLQKNPNDINALYLHLAVYQTKILDYESYHADSPKFITVADSVKNILEKRIGSLKGKDSLICLFYLANVYGGISLMHAKTGNWIDGVKNGMNSVSLLKQVKKALPSFYAAYLGIGVFNYYFSSSLNWLPFANGRWQEGLSYIETAVNSESPFNYAAKNTLCWILIERKEYKRADSIASSVLSEFPCNTIFLRIKALVNLRSGNYQDAIKNASSLLSLAQARDPVNWSDCVAAYYILVESYSQTGMVNEMRCAADAILKEEIPQSYSSVPHIKKNLKYIREHREEVR
jgi:hypothetical protein